ncbi:hypothetical protein Lal_00033262 [Lupinus albus]|nr:hypothetical protein Lal_00033262 [Lupinus albus]
MKKKRKRNKELPVWEEIDFLFKNFNLNGLSNNLYDYYATNNSARGKKKSFARALKNSCDVAISQLPQPYIKGDVIAIKILEDDYQTGLQRCKTHLHGRLILSKGDTTIKFNDLKSKLVSLWSMIGKWSMISLGRGFDDFSFSSVKDMRSVYAMGS